MGCDQWRQTTLGDFVTLQRGHDLPEYSRKPGTVPVMGSFGITGYHSESRTKGPGVTVGRSGASFGIVSYCKEDFWPLNTALYVTDFHCNYPRFAYYLLKSIDFTRFNSGSAQPSLNRNFIHPTPIKVPGYDEQTAIANFLGALDDKIELNRRINETLEATARAIFRSWFMQSDPPDENPRNSFGSRQKPLTEAFQINPPRELGKGAIALYVDMANMPTSTARVLGTVSREFTSGIRFMNGDTLVARITPCLENGKTAFVDFLKGAEVGWGSTEFIVLRPKPPLPPEYGYFLARTEDFRSFAISNMSGTSGRQRVPVDCFQNFEIAVPPAHIAAEFGKLAKALFAKMKRNDEESQTLAELRNALLPKLISGEIRIKQAAKTIEAHV